MKVRFKIEEGESIQYSDWVDESIRHREAGMLTAAVEIEKLRVLYPNARISVERDRLTPLPQPKLFRYDIFVRDGSILVVDEEGTHQRKLTNATLQSRPFQESEEPAVLLQIN